MYRSQSSRESVFASLSLSCFWLNFIVCLVDTLCLCEILVWSCVQSYATLMLAWMILSLISHIWSFTLLGDECMLLISIILSAPPTRIWHVSDFGFWQNPWGLNTRVRTKISPYLIMPSTSPQSPSLARRTCNTRDTRFTLVRGIIVV